MPPDTLKPSLDHWTVIFLIVAVQGLFFSALFFLHRKGNRAANVLMGLFILLFSITLLDYVGYWTKYSWHFPHFTNIYAPLAYLFGPVLYFYFKSVHEKEPFGKWDWLHLIPFFITLGNRMDYYLLSAERKRKIIEKVALGMDQHVPPPLFSLFNLSGLVLVCHFILYAVLSKRYIRKIGATDEGTPYAEVRSKWFRLLWWLYVAFIASYASYFILLNTPYFTLIHDYAISFAMVVFIYTVGVLAFRRQEIFTGSAMQRVFMAPKYQHSTLTPNASQSLLERLLAFMENEKPYLDGDLRQTTLAEKLGVSIHHLSQVINEQLGKNFADFVNEYRVEAAKRLLADPALQNEFVIQIAYSAGFNNKTSFNKAFKNMTGVSPQEFRSAHLQHQGSEEPMPGAGKG